MARQKNSIETVQMTISVTEKVRDQLEQLTATGYYGKNAAETANALIAERIRQLVESTSPLLAAG